MRSPGAFQLLHRASDLHDAHPELSYRKIFLFWETDFNAGAKWMGAWLSQLRHQPLAVPVAPSFNRLGVQKYAIASAAFLLLLPFFLAWPSYLWLAAAVILFYAIEVQMVFLFPLALDGNPRPFAASRRLLAQTCGTLGALILVMVLAMRMLLGGFAGGGFVRSWCIGCLAVLLWYEEVRASLS